MSRGLYAEVDFSIDWVKTVEVSWQEETREPNTHLHTQIRGLYYKVGFAVSKVT